MSVLSSTLGFIGAGRAAKTIADANIAAEHGVLGAAGDAQSRIDNTLGAANTNVNAAGTAATAAVNAGATNANNVLGSTFRNQESTLAPYLAAGAQGATGLADYAASKPQFKFTLGDWQNDPGYKFQMDQGTNAITNMASRGPMGGATLAELTKFGQGLAGTYYNQAFDRARQSFDTNQNTTLSNLGALVNTGLAGTSQYNAAAMNAGNQQAGNLMGAAKYEGDTGQNLQKFLSELGLRGQESAGQFGLKGASLAGDYAVEAGKARAGGILGEYKNISQGAEDLGSLLRQIATGMGGR